MNTSHYPGGAPYAFLSNASDVTRRYLDRLEQSTLDKKAFRQSTGVFGSWRTASPQRAAKREQQRQKLKQQLQVKPQARGFGS